jgi:hypothetical protein
MMPLSPVAVTLIIFIALMSALMFFYGLHQGVAVTRRGFSAKDGDLD